MADENKYNIKIECGTDFVLPFVWTDDNGNPYNLTGATVTAQLREYSGSPDALDFICTHNNAGGRIMLVMPNEVTKQITYSYGVYDVTVSFVNGSVKHPLYGEAKIQGAVTKPLDGEMLITVAIESYAKLPTQGLLNRLYYIYDEQMILRWNGTNYVSAFEFFELHPEGAWNEGTAYQKYATVTNAGSSYMALQNVPVGIDIHNTTYWLKLAEAGGAENIDDEAGEGDTTKTWSADKISGKFEDNGWMLLKSWECFSKVCDIQDLNDYSANPSNYVEDITYDSNRDVYYICMKLGQIKVIDPATLTVTSSYDLFETAIGCIDYNPDADRIYANTDSKTYVIDPSDMSIVSNYNGKFLYDRATQKIIKLSSTSNVSLTISECDSNFQVVDTYVVPFDGVVSQGACVHNGMLYTANFARLHETKYRELRYNYLLLSDHEQTGRAYEIEGMCFIGNEFIIMAKPWNNHDEVTTLYKYGKPASYNYITGESDNLLRNSFINNYYTFAGGALISPNTDADTITNPGEYVCDNTSKGTITNVPADVKSGSLRFRMRVVRNLNADSSYFTQILDTQQGHRYVRSYTGSFSNWIDAYVNDSVVLFATGDKSIKTFTMKQKIALVAGKRGANYQVDLVDQWTSGSVTILANGDTLFSITKSASSDDFTVTNVSGSQHGIIVIL